MNKIHTASSPLMSVLKQGMVQTVVHDLKTPMTVIKGNLLLLLSGVMGTMSSEQQLLIERSVGPLEELILMTENLLQAATLDKDEPRLEMAASDLDVMLAETIEFYKMPFQQRGMRIFRDGNTIGCQLSVDAFWMKRVLHNLIWNAYKFTPDNGEVVLRVQHTADGGLQILVEDSGRGIAREKLETIFEKFSQAQSKDRKIGTGLGLWICKRVMELHGGSIRVESTEGTGSRFILTIPAKRVL
jgi:signal transduction histidine kinase